MLFLVPLRSVISAGRVFEWLSPDGFCEVKQGAQALSRNTLAQLAVLTYEGLN